MERKFQSKDDSRVNETRTDRVSNTYLQESQDDSRVETLNKDKLMVLEEVEKDNGMSFSSRANEV